MAAKLSSREHISQRVVFAWWLRGAQWSQIGHVVVFISQAAEGGPTEAFITDLETKTAFTNTGWRNGAVM